MIALVSLLLCAALVGLVTLCIEMTMIALVSLVLCAALVGLATLCIGDNTLVGLVTLCIEDDDALRRTCGSSYPVH